MMTGMNGSQKMTHTDFGVVASGRCLTGFAGHRSDMEVVMTKILTGMLAVAIVAAVVVGGSMTGAKTFAHSGMMPEVVSTAEMPRLVMPTVEVHAFRTVAMSTSVYNVN
jgi:hypothetical protein